MKANSVNKKKLVGRFDIYRPVLILLVICVFATILSPSSLSTANLSNVFRQITVAGIAGCGMAFVILIGEIDLSIGSILGLVGVLAPGILGSTDNVGVIIPAVLVVGIGCGAVSGSFVAACEIPPSISTPSMMILLHGCILAYTKDSPIPIKVDGYRFFGKGTVAGVPVPVIILIILFFIAHYVLTQTSYGRSIYVFGGNREAARLSGISARFIEWMAYASNGPMCGVAGVILTARLGSAQPISDIGIETDAIAAVILGGTSLSSGVGSVLPTVAGAMIMGIIDNILTLTNVNSHATNTVKGVVILIAVLVDKKVRDPSAKAGQQIENRANTK